MKIAALIPAKAVSNRLRQKNLQEIHGVPMFTYSVQALLESAEVGTVYVSTDSTRIAEIADAMGAFPVDRPEHLAHDPAEVADVVDDFIDTYDVAARALLVMQPNHPCVDPTDVQPFCRTYVAAHAQFGVRELITTDEFDITNGALRMFNLDTYCDYAYSVYVQFYRLESFEVHVQQDLRYVERQPGMEDRANTIKAAINGTGNRH